MDAPCKIQGSIHVFRLVNNMCPGKWVHIKMCRGAFYFTYPVMTGITNQNRLFHHPVWQDDGRFHHSGLSCGK